jgi:hypothetical protein
MSAAGGTTSVTTTRLQFGSANIDICVECDGRVYPVEKVFAGHCVYHKWCFRCAKCNCVLSVNNYAIAGAGIPYCTPHFTATFRQRGNFADFALKRIDESTSSALLDAENIDNPPTTTPQDSTSSTSSSSSTTTTTTSSSSSAAAPATAKWIQSTSPRPLNPVNRYVAGTSTPSRGAFSAAAAADGEDGRDAVLPPQLTTVSVRDATAMFEARALRLVSV